MSRRGKAYHTISDSPDQIKMCLDCVRPVCIDCIGRRIDMTTGILETSNPTIKHPVLSDLSKRVIAAYRGTVTCDREIAEKIGAPVSSVTSVRRKYGLPPPRSLSVDKRNKLIDERIGREV